MTVGSKNCKNRAAMFFQFALGSAKNNQRSVSKQQFNIIFNRFR